MSMFRERYGDDAPAEIAGRSGPAHRCIPITLATITKVAEPG